MEADRLAVQPSALRVSKAEGAAPPPPAPGCPLPFVSEEPVAFGCDGLQCRRQCRHLYRHQCQYIAFRFQRRVLAFEPLDLLPDDGERGTHASIGPAIDGGISAGIDGGIGAGPGAGILIEIIDRNRDPRQAVVAGMSAPLLAANEILRLKAQNDTGYAKRCSC